MKGRIDEVSAPVWWLYSIYFFARFLWALPRVVRYAYRVTLWNSENAPGAAEEMRQIKLWIFKPWPEIEEIVGPL